MLTRLFIGGLIFFGLSVSAQRVPVLNQIDLPHNYYFRELYLPQLTSGPSSVSWSPDSKQVVYSMAGSLWIQTIGTDLAIQLTDGNGYDYQPDWSPTANAIVFVRYTGAACELMLLNLNNNQITALTNNLAVNLEPKWSPDGKQIAFISTQKTRHFLLHVADVRNNQLINIQCLTPDTQSQVKRYYYSAFDHAINPAWSADGKKILYVSNHEIAHGTGHIVSLDLETKKTETILQEETNWQLRPDASPDGTRLVYSSYLGRNHNQLWAIPVNGGYAMPLTYGEFDNWNPRWSRDGQQIAIISNRSGNTSLWVLNVFDGKQSEVKAVVRKYLSPRKNIILDVKDENGNTMPARVSIVDSRGKFYAPNDAWIHADDSWYPLNSLLEAHYCHTPGIADVALPDDKVFVTITRGPEYELLKKEMDVREIASKKIELVLKKQKLPPDANSWRSADLHVHMNYGGTYGNTPERLARQADAENLSYVFNMVVNKEQRIPDVQYFSPIPFKSQNTVISHAQEFHTSFWGHLGLLNLTEHLILPDYSGYPGTAAASLFPHNSFIADRTHEQQGVVGYVHPFEQSEVFPEQAANLFNEFPVDVALGKVDYYELIGFSDHKASEAVWYQILNTGKKIPAGAGTDAMANYASLRGPVGLNRVYVKQPGELNVKEFLHLLKKGKSFVTNGPLLGLTVDGKSGGDSISIVRKGKEVAYSAFLQSQIPIDHFEIVFNGEVIASHTLAGDKRSVDVHGTLKLRSSGWLVLRVWNDRGHPDLFDLYAYASTNPIYIISEIPNPKQKAAADYFLKWVNRISNKLPDLTFRTASEKQNVQSDIESARKYYERLKSK